MGQARICLKKTIEILAFYHSFGEVQKTVKTFSNRSFTVQQSQILKWLREKSALKIKSKGNLSAKSIHIRKPDTSFQMERQIYDWIVEQHHNEFSVSTTSIISKALAQNQNSKHKFPKTLMHWVFPFLSR